MSRIVYCALIRLTSRDRAEAPHPPADDLDLHQTGLNALALTFAEGDHKEPASLSQLAADCHPTYLAAYA